MYIREYATGVFDIEHFSMPHNNFIWHIKVDWSGFWRVKYSISPYTTLYITIIELKFHYHLQDHKDDGGGVIISRYNFYTEKMKNPEQNSVYFFIEFYYFIYSLWYQYKYTVAGLNWSDFSLIKIWQN